MKRVLSALVLGPAVLLILLAAPPFVGVILVAAINVIAVVEMRKLVAPGESFPTGMAILGAFIMPACAWKGGETGLASGLAASVLILMTAGLVGYRAKGAARGIANGVFVLVFPVWALTHAVLFLGGSQGPIALFYLLLVIWTCDTSAYLFGSAFGKRKLAPTVSPNKSVEGFLAGLVSSLPVSVAFYYLSSLNWSLSFIMAAGLIIAFAGQLGDLVESAIKRGASVKDSGSLIPGHGGILDRIDSLLFAVPVFYYLVQLSRSGF